MRIKTLSPKLLSLLLLLLCPLLIRALEPYPEASPIAEASERVDANSFSFAFQIYEEVISPIDGDRCRMYPSCSQFSKEAIAKKGLLKGILMSADRIMRCGMDKGLYPTLSIGEIDYHHDPPE